MWDIQEKDGHCEVGTGQKDDYDVVKMMMMMMMMMMIMKLRKVGSSML